MANIIVMISGEGTNLQHLLDAQAKNELKEGRIKLVVSNRQDARGLERATKAGVETLYFPLNSYTDAGKSREEYDADLAQKLLAYEPDLIVLAGWMHILSSAFLDHFPRRVINLHPALAGKFPGTNAIERAFEAYHRGEIPYSGCMVHYVTPEVDAGELIRQIVVPLTPNDDMERFVERMHMSERFILLKAIKQFLYERRTRKKAAKAT